MPLNYILNYLITPFFTRSREGRFSIKTRDYIAKYNLGNPVAGNYYQAQYDDFVPILKAQLE